MKLHTYALLLACGVQFIVYGMEVPKDMHPLQIQLSDGKESEIIDTPFLVKSDFINEPLLCDIDSIPLSQQKEIVENLCDAVYPVKPCVKCLKKDTPFVRIYFRAENINCEGYSRDEDVETNFFTLLYPFSWSIASWHYITLDAKHIPAGKFKTEGPWKKAFGLVDNQLSWVGIKPSCKEREFITECLKNIMVSKFQLGDEFEKQYPITALKYFKQRFLKKKYFNKLSHLLLCSDMFLQQYRDQVVDTQWRKILPIIAQQKALTEKSLGKEYWQLINLNERLRHIGNSRVIVNDENDTDSKNDSNEADVTMCQLLSNWCKDALNFKFMSVFKK